MRLAYTLPIHTWRPRNLKMNNQKQIDLIREQHATLLVRLAFSTFLGQQPFDESLRHFSTQLRNQADPSNIFSQIRKLSVATKGASEATTKDTTPHPQTKIRRSSSTQIYNLPEPYQSSVQHPQPNPKTRRLTLHPPGAFGGGIYADIRRTVCMVCA